MRSVRGILAGAGVAHISVQVEEDRGNTPYGGGGGQPLAAYY